MTTCDKDVQHIPFKMFRIAKLDPIGSLHSRIFNYVFEGRNFSNSSSEINKLTFKLTLHSDCTKNGNSSIFPNFTKLGNV